MLRVTKLARLGTSFTPRNTFLNRNLPVRTFSTTPNTPNHNTVTKEEIKINTNETLNNISKTHNASQKPGFLKSFAKLLKISSPNDIMVDPSKFNRFKVIPAAILTHLSLGSVFAFSLLSQPFMTIEGVVDYSAMDWTMNNITPIFSTLMMSFGLSSMILGKMNLNQRLGVRATSLLGGSIFSTGFIGASMAANLHCLPLLYASYAFAGTGVGIAYVNPISNLMKWFQDRKGLAGALGVVGFGAGGIVSAPIIQKFVSTFQKAPIFVGSTTDVPTITKNGRIFVDINTIPQSSGVNIETIKNFKYTRGSELTEMTDMSEKFAHSDDIASKTAHFENLREVVVATKDSLLKLGDMGTSLSEGLYLVGSGDSGIAGTLIAMSALYGAVILSSAFVFRAPPDNYDPTISVTSTTTSATDSKTTLNTTNTTATAPVKTPPKFPYFAESDADPKLAVTSPQFRLLWLGMCLNGIGAYGLIANAKPMLIDIFSSTFPALITPALAMTFVSALSFSNLSGRLLWGAASDKIGTRNTFHWLFGLGAPAYLMMTGASEMLKKYQNPDPSLISEHASTITDLSSALPVPLFSLGVFIAISTFGGTAATSQSYLSDLFGAKYRADLHGQLLSFLLIAGLLGPVLFSYIREKNSKEACLKLSALVSDELFLKTFGDSKDNLEELITAKTVTISRLMSLCPEGTSDPTPYLYNEAIYIVAALQAIALIANLMIRKVPPKYFPKK